MNLLRHRGMVISAALLALCGCAARPAAAQTPASTLIPIVVDTAAPIVVNTIKPKPLPAGVTRFDGFVVHANTAQITVRARNNEVDLQTFSLSPVASAKMQATIDKGGYQYGDRVTVIYNTANQIALQIKGKPSRPL
jgi:type IV pilus biogenesis protein CpaD/CtpE